jgi:hypothetical protein
LHYLFACHFSGKCLPYARTICQEVS